MADGKLCSSPAGETMVQASSRKSPQATRPLHYSRRLCPDRGWIVRLLLPNILRPPIRTQNDQRQDWRYPQVPLHGKDGRDGGKRTHRVEVRKESLRTLYRPRVSSN